MKIKFCLGLGLILLAGSGCTSHWDRLKPLKQTAFTGNLSRHDAPAVVIFEDVVPGKPLPEIVWDNTGPFWDLEHSKTIGFTQNYTDYFFWTKIETRLMVPFGRIFSGKMTSAISNSFSAYRVAYDGAELKQLANNPTDIQVTVAVTRFAVWEAPLNHLNFSLEGRYRVVDRVKNISKEYQLSRKAGPIALGFETHSQAIDDIARMTDTFAQQATAEILQNSHF